MKTNRKEWISCIGQGWHNLLNETFDKMEQVAIERHADLCITDVREKYGSLRIEYEIQGNYLKMGNEEKSLYDALDELVAEAERISETICELCGASGEIREDLSWVKTLCDDCYSRKKSTSQDNRKRKIILFDDNKKIENYSIIKEEGQTNWLVHVWSAERTDLCKPMTFYDKEVAVKFVHQLHHADSHRAEYIELRFYDPFMKRKMKDIIIRFMNGEICAGELDRFRHDFKKSMIHLYGGIPSQEIIDRFAEKELASIKEKETLIEETFQGPLHPLQQDEINRWLNNEISSERLILNLLQMRQMIANTFPG